MLSYVSSVSSFVTVLCKYSFLNNSYLQIFQNILRKGGHTEIEPQHFCQVFQREKGALLVIIRNEDIASHLHQVGLEVTFLQRNVFLAFFVILKLASSLPFYLGERLKPNTVESKWEDNGFEILCC